MKQIQVLLQMRLLIIISENSCFISQVPVVVALTLPVKLIYFKGIRLIEGVQCGLA
jgi:hypothetical protein